MYSGKYTLRGENDAGYDEVEIDVTILSSATIQTADGSTTYEVTLGQQLQINMNVQGIPKPKLTWSRNGIRIASNGRRMV